MEIRIGDHGVRADDDAIPNGAFSDYTEAIRLDQMDSIAYYNRGIDRAAKGDLEGVISDFDETIHLNPMDATAYTIRGLARRSKGDLDEAISDCTEAIRLDPTYANAYNIRAYAYFPTDPDRAFADINKALELDPNEANYYDSRGEFYEKQGKHQFAAQDYQRAMDLVPPSSKLYADMRSEARQAYIKQHLG
jgi:tetratricopeptide (TPR) repeat protein